MVICLERGADLHMAQLMPLPLIVSCFSKIQIGVAFLVPAHLCSPGKRAIKRVCVCPWTEKLQDPIQRETAQTKGGIHSTCTQTLLAINSYAALCNGVFRGFNKLRLQSLLKPNAQAVSKNKCPKEFGKLPHCYNTHPSL